MKHIAQTPNAFTRLAFSANETAQILGVSRATIYRMIALGEIRPISHSGTHRFSQKEIDRYLANTMELAAWTNRAMLYPRARKRNRRYRQTGCQHSWDNWLRSSLRRTERHRGRLPGWYGCPSRGFRKSFQAFAGRLIESGGSVR